VPHVHVHVLPRRAGDFEKNDAVYDAIDEHARAHACAPPHLHQLHATQQKAFITGLRNYLIGSSHIPSWSGQCGSVLLPLVRGQG